MTKSTVFANPISSKKSMRVRMMMWAMLHHHARPEYRNTAWLYLLEWARLGGTPDEVPHD